MKKLRWEAAPRKVPAHPYRDTAIFYAILVGIFIGVTALTGGDMRRALILAPMIYVVVTAYSWWRWREKIRAEARAEKL